MSEPFFKKAWTRRELEALELRSISDGIGLLPVWHGISKDEVQAFSPTLVNRFALSTSQPAIDEIAENIAERIVSPGAVDAAEVRGRAIERTESSGANRSIEPGQIHRFALVAPRLVTSHSASERGEPITAGQGVALLAQGRFRDLKRIADESQEVPDPAQLPEGADWGWQFAAAFWEWATTDDTGRLRSVFGSAPDAGSKTAAGVLLSCALRRAGQISEALAVLDGLAGDELEVADRGWALVQRARTRAEAGDDEGSRADAEAALGVVEGLDDETAKAFDAAARWHLFSLDPLSAEYGRALEAPDNEAPRWDCARGTCRGTTSTCRGESG